MRPFLSSFCDFQRLQRKSLPPSLSQTLSAEEEDSLSSQPAAATEEPAEQLSSPPTNQAIPEPPLPVQTSATRPPETLLPVQTSATILPETLLPVQTSATIFTETLLPVQTSATKPPVPGLSKTPVESTPHPAQEETTVLPVQVFPTLPPGDTGLPEAQEVSTSVSVISTPPPVQTVTAPSLPLNSVVSSVLPVLSAPTLQPEVEELLPSTIIFVQ